MSYEEKYKEALKRADSLTEKYGGREFAEYVFPELAESDDERIRKKIIENVRLSGGYTDEEIDEMISWLERQKKQKPAEWSEKDEEMLKDIIAEIEATKQYFFTHDSEGRAQMQARIDWLKSLRPSWKPSEEQMEVDLEKEIEKYFKGWTETDEGIACHYQYVDLNTCRSIARHFYELGLKARKE